MTTVICHFIFMFTFMRLLITFLLLACVPHLSAQLSLGPNLSISGPGAGSDGSSKAGSSSYNSVRDGDSTTFWSPASTTNEHVTIKWSSQVSTNTIILREVGDRVTSWTLETREGVVLATGTTIGTELQVSYADVSTDKIFLYLHAASALSQIGEFEVYSATGGGGGPTAYTLSVNNAPANGGSVSLSPAGTTYAPGTVVTLTATPSSGYTFGNWNGDASGTSATTTLTMNGNLNVTANYQLSGGGGGSDGGLDSSLVGYATLAGGTTGGAGGTWIIASTGTEIQDAIKNKGTQPLTIYIDGVITPDNSSGLSKIDIKDVRDVSLLGMGSGADFNGIGIKIFRAGNVIIRNLKVHEVSIGDKDCISLEGPVDHVWVDHCELYNQFQGVGQNFYDGLFDLKAETDFVTFSWNYLHDSWKCSLSGSSESDVFPRRVTYHHNIYENINSRAPLFRSGQGHVYNNFYKAVASTAINSRINACVRIENNYFEDVNNPWVSAYSNVLGAVQTVGNTLVNSPFDYSPNDTHEPLSCTLELPYSYLSTLDSASDLPLLLQQNAGVGVVNFSPFVTSLSDGIQDRSISARLAWQQSLKLIPNPSQGRFQLQFELPTNDRVAVRIYNRLGQQVATLAEAPFAAGLHDVWVEQSLLPPGLYVVVATSRLGKAQKHLVIH